MIGQMAIATCIAFPRFNDLGCSITPIFLLMDHFLYEFPALSKKKSEENLSISTIEFRSF